MLPEWIQIDAVALLSAIIGSIIWFVRLEGRVNYESKMNDKAFAAMQLAIDALNTRTDTIRKEHDEMANRLFTEMGQIKVSLAEISGYLRKQNEK